MSAAPVQVPQARRRRVAGSDPAITRTALAIGLATGAYGISFGVLSVTAGLTAAQTCAMSLLVFTGASQFAAVGVVAAGGGALAALAPALVLAGRNAIYGFALVPVLRGSRLGRALQASSSSTNPRRWRVPRTTRRRPTGRSSPPA